MTKLQKLANLGQSIWLDYIRRSFTRSGELQALIDSGLRGVTSNPTIFDKAISGSSDYDEDIKKLIAEGNSVEEIYTALTMTDITEAVDLMRPVYDATDGLDGYVSLEVDPTLAYDADGTIAEGLHLFKTLDRPNVFIKVPATAEGAPAIEKLISEGVNINVTLIFSVSHYEATAEAYIAGLEKRVEAGKEVSHVASVASLFVSRTDTAVDKALEEKGETDLQGKIAVAIAKMLYARFGEIFSGERWERLVAKGARVQRPLWASTSTKNPAYPDTLYVDNLIGSSTVNTLPLATIEAFMDHGCLEPAVQTGLEDVRAQLARLSELDIDLDAITQKLQDDGVESFADSFRTLKNTIAEKKKLLEQGE